MKLTGMLPGTINWSRIKSTSHPGVAGIAQSRAKQIGDIQARFVSYSVGYISDHWCKKGHIVYVVSGTVRIEHDSGELYNLSPGMSYYVADGDDAHRLTSDEGAEVFIVD